MRGVVKNDTKRRNESIDFSVSDVWKALSSKQSASKNSVEPRKKDNSDLKLLPISESVMRKNYQNQVKRYQENKRKKYNSLESIKTAKNTMKIPSQIHLRQLKPETSVSSVKMPKVAKAAESG